MSRPSVRPKEPSFSSGPCPKRPGWSTDVLKDALLGRSHRSKAGRAKLQEAADLSREILGIPDDYLIGIVPGSDTGAVEMALWNLLGPRKVDVLGWESFGSGWVSDVLKQLKISESRAISADYGKLPDLSTVNMQHDVVFTWNGTTSGVKVPDGDWIADDRTGLTICDATSAVFAMDLPWQKLDVVTWSWQKVMGGEAAHGMMVLSPRAVERLNSYQPPWPMPKILRLTKGGEIIKDVFDAKPINTPSLLCVEDYIDALKWGKSVGGLKGLITRSMENFRLIDEWVAARPWAGFLAEVPQTRSNTSVCLTIDGPAGDMVKLLDKEGAAYDIGAYRDAPAGLRIWAGATVEAADIKALLEWLDWAYAEVTK
jgi:phosphoserine aminotransferase